MMPYHIEALNDMIKETLQELLDSDDEGEVKEKK